MADPVLSIRLPPIETKQSICLSQLPVNESNSNSKLTLISTKSEIKKFYHRTKLLSQWYRKLNDYVDKNLSNSYKKSYLHNSRSVCHLLGKPKYTSKYSDFRRTVLGEQGRKRYTDIVSVERFKSHWSEESTKSCELDQSVKTNSQWQFFQINSELDDCNLGPFQNDTEDELHRRDFEEYILLQSIPTFHLGHLYFKILKLFRYIAVTNIEGTVITLLSLTKLVKRSAEVVQAIEECNGIVVLLNLLESGIVSVQLASMKLLISLCHIIYLRRMAIAYGAVQLLVQLLVDPDDDIKLNAADLLANLAILKEARLVMPYTPGIQHLVCLLNMTAEQVVNPRKMVKSTEPTALRRTSIKFELDNYNRIEESRTDRLLKSVATALWRFSHSLTNQNTMQKFGILPTLTRLVQSNNEQILIPVLGILHGCSTNPIFRVSIRHEGILKFIIQHIQHRDLHVKLQCTRTLFNCLDDSQTIDTVRVLGGLKALVDLIKSQTDDASESLQSGWIEAKQDASFYKYKHYLDDNKNAVTVNLGAPNRETTEGTSKSRLHLVGTSNKIISPTSTTAGTGAKEEGKTSRSQSSSRGPVSIVTRTARDSEEQMITFHLLHTLLATVWKSCVGLPNKECLVNLGLCDSLFMLLDLLPPYLTIYYRTLSPVSGLLQKINLVEKVSSYALYCLGRLTELDKVKRLLNKEPELLIKIIQLLSHSSPEIVVPTIEIITGLADYWQFFHNLNIKYGFIFVFSLQLNQNKAVQQAALKCICKYLQNIPQRSSFIRKVSSSLAHLVDVLEKYYNELTHVSKHKAIEIEQVLAAICSTIAEIGCDPQGQAILSELGVSTFMVNLVAIANQESLRSAVCHAVTKFATVSTMKQSFRDKQHLATLINYVRLGGPELRLNATRALDMLSEDSIICDTIRTLDITSILLQIMHDGPKELLEAATHLIRKISISNFDKLRQTGLI